MNEQELRINAAMAELQSMVSTLLQRNVNLAGEVAVLQAKVAALMTPNESAAPKQEMPA